MHSGRQVGHIALEDTKWTQGVTRRAGVPLLVLEILVTELFRIQIAAKHPVSIVRPRHPVQVGIGQLVARDRVGGFTAAGARPLRGRAIQ